MIVGAAQAGRLAQLLDAQHLRLPVDLALHPVQADELVELGEQLLERLRRLLLGLGGRVAAVAAVGLRPRAPRPGAPGARRDAAGGVRPGKLGTPAEQAAATAAQRRRRGSAHGGELRGGRRRRVAR